MMKFKEFVAVAWSELSVGHKIGSILAIVLLIACIAASADSFFKIKSLKREVKTAKKTADEKEKRAAAMENQAAQYKQRIEFLEKNLTEIQNLARKQDENISQIADDNARARNDVSRARNVRAIEVTSAELCYQLAKVGHGCEP